jgi:hypothetical protein
MFAEPGRFPQAARSAPRVQRTENHFRFCTLLEKGSCRNVPVGADQRNQITTLCLAPTRYAHSAFREEKKNVSRPNYFVFSRIATHFAENFQNDQVVML